VPIGLGRHPRLDERTGGEIVNDGRRYPTFSRTVCALAVTGLLIVPLALYGAGVGVARNVAAAHERGGGGQYSSGGQYSVSGDDASEAQYGRDDDSSSDSQYGGGSASDDQYGSDDDNPSSAQYQYSPPGCPSTGFGLLKRFGSHGHHHHRLGANFGACSSTGNPSPGSPQGDNDGDGPGSGNPPGHESSGGGGPSQWGQGENGTRKS
jgi:hypothetical protein